MEEEIFHKPMEHPNHLCYMFKSGKVTLEQLKDLVREPMYICKWCGRVAEKSDNLCAATSIQKGSCGM
ncbi:MAG: hypothetical protein V3S97_04235 [Candidatus Bathyarchaeia archaeon]